MNLLWTEEAWEDYLYWQKNDQSVLLKINELIKNTKRDPFKGIDKPKPLKESLKSLWSRRITGEYRLIYRVAGKDASQQIEVIQCRFHY